PSSSKGRSSLILKISRPEGPPRIRTGGPRFVDLTPASMRGQKNRRLAPPAFASGTGSRLARGVPVSLGRGDNRHFVAAANIASTCSQLIRLSQNASRYFGRALR